MRNILLFIFLIFVSAFFSQSSDKINRDAFNLWDYQSEFTSFDSTINRKKSQSNIKHFDSSSLHRLVMYKQFLDTNYKNVYYEFTYVTPNLELFIKNEYYSDLELRRQVISDGKASKMTEYFQSGNIRSISNAEVIDPTEDSVGSAFFRQVFFHENGNIDQVYKSDYLYRSIQYDSLGGIKKKGQMHYDVTWVGQALCYKNGEIDRIITYQNLLDYNKNKSSDFKDGITYVFNSKGKCMKVEEFRNNALILKRSSNKRDRQNAAKIINEYN